MVRLYSAKHRPGAGARRRAHHPELAADAAATAQTSQFVMAMINYEDRLGLEAVQVGAGSRFAERGHLSSKEWPGMLAFYRNLAIALVGDHPGAS